MKKLTSKLSSILIIGSCCSLSSCALVTVPVKVVGKVATTSIGVAGKVAGGAVDIVTPNGSKKSGDADE